MKKLLIAAVAVLGILVAAIGAAFIFREDLARYAAGRFLADGQLTLTRLQGLQLSRTQLSIAELEFLLNESGQRLVIGGLEVGYRVTTVSSAPEVDSITIRSAQLLAAPAPSDAAPDDRGSADPGMRRSEVLALLRDFPLANLSIAELRIPQRSEALAARLQKEEGQLALTVDSGDVHLQAEFAQADAAASARFDLSLARGDATIADLALSLQPVDEGYTVAGNGTLAITDLNELLDALEQAPLPVPLLSAQLEWDLAGALADDPSVNGAGALLAVTLGLQPGSTLTLPAALASGLGEVALEFVDRVELTLMHTGGWVVTEGRLPLQLATAWQDQPVTVDAVLSVTECALPAGAPCEIGFDGDAALGMYTMTGGLQVQSAAAGAYHVDTRGLALGGLPEWLPAFDLAADLAVTSDAVAFRTPLLLPNAPANAGIVVEGMYDLAAGTADVNVVLPEVRFTEGGGALSAWFGSWPYTFDLLAGLVAADVDAHWQGGVLTGAVNGRLEEVGGFYGDYFFRGVNTTLEATVDTAAEFPIDTPPLMLSVAGLDVGLPVEDIRAAFRLDRAGLLQIEYVIGNALDGSVSARDVTYDFDSERNDILVTFGGLRIEKMMDLVEYDGVEASGGVTGEVPLTLTPNGVEVANGRLYADAPGGTIRYVAATMGATGNPGLDLMNQALGNYQFDSLTSDIEYTPEGELLLSMKLQGRNPDMNEGQRINLNLNLSDNVPALLESLQAARAIEDFLEAQYQ